MLARAAHDVPALTVDLSEVQYCDSAALRALFSVAACVKLTLKVRARGPVTVLLDISGLDRVATVVTID